MLSKLKTHLSPLERRGLIDPWHDRNIRAGSDWKREIDKHLDEAQMILLLVSPDFIASNYCYGVEMKRALERYEQGEADVIPVILRPVKWQDTPLGKLQALPRDAKPISDWTPQDRGLKNVADGINKIIQEMEVSSTKKKSKAWPFLDKAHETPFWIEEQMASDGQPGANRAGLTWIISGGQTGADRAASDWVLAHGKQHGIKQGGWCSHGRQAEDGPIDNCYRLKETPSGDYTQRTEWNVCDSNGTVIFSMAQELYGGSKLTQIFAEDTYHKPCLHIYKHKKPENPAEELLKFLRRYDIRILNIAGPRAEGTEAEVGEFVREVLDKAIG